MSRWRRQNERRADAQGRRLLVRPLAGAAGIRPHRPGGEGMGVVGRNGARKSTLLRSISRVHSDCRGVIERAGTSLARLSPDAVARMGLSFVREGAPVVGELSVVTNLDLARRLAKLRGQEPVPYEEVWKIFPVLATKQNLPRRPAVRRPAADARPGLGDRVAADGAATGRALGRSRARGLRQHLPGDPAALRSGSGRLIAEQNRDWLDGVADRSVLLETGRLHHRAVPLS